MGQHGLRAACFLIACILTSGWAAGQASQTKNVPAMTSDETEAVRRADVNTAPVTKLMPGEAMPQGWVRYFPANCGLSIALPRRPLEADLPISAQDKSLFRSGSDSFYTDGSLTVIAAHFQTVTPTPASSIVDSFFQGLAEGNGARSLKYSAEPTDRPTRTSVVATYRAESWRELEGFIEVIGTHGWFVVAIRRQGDVQAKEKGRRVLASALFDGPSCVD